MGKAVEEKIVEAYRHHEWFIPEYTMAGLQRYINEGQPVGDFLRAVLCNNLADAVGYADDHNVNNLPAYTVYLHNKAPSGCHGSVDKYNAWIKKFADARKAEREREEK